MVFGNGIMPSAEEYLLEWARFYALNRDVHKKEIKDVKEKDGHLIMTLKEGTQEYVVSPELNEKALSGLHKTQNMVIVTFNSKKSIDGIVAHWNQFSQFPNLTVIFVNPVSKLELKWAIRPHIHNQICDIKALRPGLKSLASGVDLINEEGIKKVLASA